MWFRVQVRGNFHNFILTSKKKKKTSEGGVKPPNPPPGSATGYEISIYSAQSVQRQRWSTIHATLLEYTWRRSAGGLMYFLQTTFMCVVIYNKQRYS